MIGRRRRLEQQRAQTAARSERALRAAGERAALLERILDSATQGIVLVDRRGETVVTNAAARRLLGPGRTDALPALPRVAVSRVAMRAMDDSAEAIEEREFHVPARRRMSMRAIPAEDGALVLIDDVTEVHRAAQVRRDFVANVSHELRTPVAGIALLAEQLAGALREDPAAAERFAGRIGEEAARLSALVGDLLDLSRIESDLPLAPAPLDAATLLKEAARRVAVLAEAKGIRVEVTGGDGVTLVADRTQVSVALTNLLDNAVRYSPPDVPVHARVEATGPEVSFAVEDHGVGIPTEDVGRIFERFYRVDRARSRATGGTGLGLAIVRHVAERHGGRVECRSSLGQGSTFILTLPREGES